MRREDLLLSEGADPPLLASSPATPGKVWLDFLFSIMDEMMPGPTDFRGCRAALPTGGKAGTLGRGAVGATLCLFVLTERPPGCGFPALLSFAFIDPVGLGTVAVLSLRRRLWPLFKPASSLDSSLGTGGLPPDVPESFIMLRVVGFVTVRSLPTVGEPLNSGPFPS
jgi:hypothetical protein